MKKILIIIVSLFCLTGCLKRDNLEDITIYTTVYPIEYIVTELYGNHSTIKSIYPNSVDINKYELTGKQIKDYSKEDMYIFDGLSKEKEYVNTMFKFNKRLMIIDTTLSMEMNYDREELWLDPSNLLMMALNTKNGLLEYISNHYLKNEIEENYNNLKVKISNIDAKLKLLNESSDNKTIVIDNDVFKFLEKYGFNIISLHETENLTQKTIIDVKNMIKKGEISYIYTLDENNLNKTVTNLINETGVKTLKLNGISNLTEKQRSLKEDYITLLNENIELFKNEIYN